MKISYKRYRFPPDIIRHQASTPRFFDTHAAIYNTFTVQRHLISRSILRRLSGEAMDTWNAATKAA